MKKKMPEDQRYRVWYNHKYGDCLTVVDMDEPDTNWRRDGLMHDCLCMNYYPTHPSMGISQFSTCQIGRHLGDKKIFSLLPKDIRDHIRERMNPKQV